MMLPRGDAWALGQRRYRKCCRDQRYRSEPPCRAARTNAAPGHCCVATRPRPRRGLLWVLADSSSTPCWPGCQIWQSVAAAAHTKSILPACDSVFASGHLHTVHRTTDVHEHSPAIVRAVCKAGLLASKRMPVKTWCLASDRRDAGMSLPRSPVRNRERGVRVVERRGGLGPTVEILLYFGPVGLSALRGNQAGGAQLLLVRHIVTASARSQSHAALRRSYPRSRDPGRIR